MMTFSESEKKDLLFSSLVFVVGVALAFVSLSYPKESSFFPVALSILLICLSLTLGYKTLRNRKGEAPNIKTITLQEMFNRNTVLVIIFTAIYIFSITKIGFYVSTYFYVVIVSYALSYKNKFALVLWPGILCACIWVIFSFSLRVPTPKGFLF